jgi:uncharacterized protein (TIGR02145 family)
MGICQTNIIHLTFLGEDAQTHNNVSLESVYVKNETLGCDTMIYGSMPTITLNYSLGIKENSNSVGSSFFIVSYNPNPFSESTLVTICVKQRENLSLFLLDVQGKILAEIDKVFEVGFHNFQISSSINGVLVLHITNGKYSQTLKLVSLLSGFANNKVSYLGIAHPVNTKTQSVSGFVFHLGDQLSFKGIATGYNDKIIIDSPTQNKSYTFLMSPTTQNHLPTVTTADVTNINNNTATCGGNVISDGGAPVTARGVCWSISPDPTILDNHTSDSIGIGHFVSLIHGLAVNTKYFVKAYAANSVGIGYGDTISFSTFTCGQNIEYEGKYYNTVLIGNQCWFKDNLDVGIRINRTQNANPTNNIIEKYCYDDNEDNCVIYGALYQWEELMQGSWNAGVKGICPPGWHIPTYDEWIILGNYLGGAGIAGGKMKETGFTHWNPPNEGATNESGFTALPTGSLYGNYDGLGDLTAYWSSTYWNSYFCWQVILSTDDTELYGFIQSPSESNPVRCLFNK